MSGYVTRRVLLRWLREALQSTLQRSMPALWDTKVWVKRAEHADWASNAALVLSSAWKMSPQEIAAQLIEGLNAGKSTSHAWHEPIVWRIEEAKGFLNIQLSDEFIQTQIERAQQEGARYGVGNSLSGQKINVEFVSADPTGPLTLASARIAAGGEALCRLLEAQGATVTREFFLNDVESNSKMRLLGDSVAYFYRQIVAPNADTEQPEEILSDKWVRSVAQQLAQREGDKYAQLPTNEAQSAFAHAALEAAVAAQKQTLENFGVKFDVWTSEAALHAEGRVQAALETLKERGYAYERNGVWWLRTTAFDDETDRPLLRANAKPTYLASDIAYHLYKFERGFDRLINIWTAEHRTYIQRTQAALKACGRDASELEVLPCEGARVLRDGTPVLVDDGGGPVTLEEELQEIDADVLRFFFVARSWDEAVEIETETARRDDESNPAYAAQLLPSRLATLIRENEAKVDESTLQLSEAEQTLQRLVAVWPDEAETAALRREPERVARFVTEMSGAVRQLVQTSTPQSTSVARLSTLQAAHVVAQNALNLLGITPRDQF
jgi:arginyl-tRNA synthetase